MRGQAEKFSQETIFILQEIEEYLIHQAYFVLVSKKIKSWSTAG